MMLMLRVTRMKVGSRHLQAAPINDVIVAPPDASVGRAGWCDDGDGATLTMQRGIVMVMRRILIAGATMLRTMMMHMMNIIMIMMMMTTMMMTVMMMMALGMKRTMNMSMIRQWQGA